MQKPSLGDQELQVLRYVQEHAPAAVSEVALHFAESRGLARTTLLTVMERLRKKGYLTRRRIDGRYRYSPGVKESDLVRSLVRDFAERMTGASLLPAVAYLIEDADLTEGELRDLEALVRSLKSKRKEAGNG